MTNGSTAFTAFALVSGPKILPSVIKADGDCILSSLLRLREKVGDCKVEKTWVQRVEFQHGGFRVHLPVAKRTLRKYKEGGTSILNSLNLQIN